MPDPKWLEWANRIRAIAAAGQTYTRDDFDRERYDMLEHIAAEILSTYTDTDEDTLFELIDVLAAFFKHFIHILFPELIEKLLQFLEQLFHFIIHHLVEKLLQLLGCYSGTLHPLLIDGTV